MFSNGNLPSELLPSFVTPSLPTFTLTNSMDMIALGLRPKIDCSSEDDLDIEAQLSSPNDPRQQFQLAHDGQIVSVGCPGKVMAAVLDSSGSCSGMVGLQTFKPTATQVSRRKLNLFVSVPFSFTGLEVTDSYLFYLKTQPLVVGIFQDLLD